MTRSACALLLIVFACPAQERVPTGPLVTSERWPRAADLVTWTRDVMRVEDLENASETAQAKAFFEWLRGFCRMAVGGMIQAYEGEHGRERYVLDAHKNLFVYGWGYCDTCSRIAEAAWKEYKRDASAAERVCVLNAGGGYHTMYRLRLDGGHGAFDPRYGYYAIDRDAPDARILDWAEVGVDENLLGNRSFKHRSRPYFEYGGQEWKRALALKPVWFESEDAWNRAGAPPESVFGNTQYAMGTRFHDMNFRLPKGTVLERFWDNSARKFYIPANPQAQRELPFLPSGRFYRVNETYLDGNWPKYDPNYKRNEPYLANVPVNEGYGPEVAGGRTIGQAWGRLTYTPDLRAPGFPDLVLPGSTLVKAAAPPYLRPPSASAAGAAVMDFYSPYVLVDGSLDADLAGDARLEIRTLAAKPANESAPDVWSAWQTVASGPGKAAVELGRSRFNGRDVSIHGVYRFQIRIAVDASARRKQPAGLNSLQLRLWFENGIMSLPRIFAGRNRVRFELRDAALLRAPVRVTYKYRLRGGKSAVHERVLRPGDFNNGTAAYTIDAPGLERCESVAVAY